MTKAEVLRALAMTEPQLAKLLEITPAAVYQWPDDEPIPYVRHMELYYQHGRKQVGKPGKAPADKAVA